MIERQRAKRWATDRAWKYRIVPSKLAQYLCLCENQTVDSSKSEHGQSEARTSIAQNQDNNIDPIPKPSYTQPQTGEVAVEKKEVAKKQGVASGKEEVVETLEQPTQEEIAELCTQLRSLSPDISINPQVRNAIRSFWHNVPFALDRVKNAIAQGWCKQPTGLFVQTLKVGVSGEGEAVVVAKEYPRPTLLQLNQLGEMGELVYTKLNEPGYAEVLAVNIGRGVLPWWVVLGVELV